MNLLEKMELLDEVRNHRGELERIINCNIVEMSVNRLFFSDNEITPTIYLIVEEDNKEDIAIEKKLMSVMDNVVFDVVNKEYYKINIANTSQIF